MRPLVLVLALGACGSGKAKPDDCAIVHDTPAQAIEELGTRYAHDAQKVAEAIERCVAPTGDDCWRATKILAAFPKLSPLQLPAGVDLAQVCADGPADLRRCLLPSYQLAHGAECKNLPAAMQLVAQTPLPAAPPPTSRGDECGFISIYIEKTGLWMQTSREAKNRCYKRREAGALDTAWLDGELRLLRRHPCGPTAAEVAAAADMPLQDVITVMDRAVQAGFIDIQMSPPDKLAVPLVRASTNGSARQTPTHCPLTLIAPDPRQSAKTAMRVRPASGSGAGSQSDPLIVVVTREKVSVAGADIATIADAKRGHGKLAALTKALPAAHDATIILQADATTPAAVIDRVVETAKAAGYDNVLFAVNDK